MQFVLFHNEYIILTWVKKHFWNTLGMEHSIWNRYIRDMETNFSNGLFALSSWSLDTKSSQNVGNKVANP